MGCCKPLLLLGDKPAIRWCLDSLAGAGLDEVVVVLGTNGEEIAENIAALPVTLAWNRAADSDMAGSVKIGLEQASRESSAFLIFPVDYPLVAPATIRRLLAEQDRYRDDIIIPTHQGRKGHPVLFPRPILEELARFSTLREIIRHHPQRQRMLAVADEAVLLEMDTPAEYRQLQTWMAQRGGPGPA